MTEQKNFFNAVKIVVNHKNQEKIMFLFGTNMFKISDCFFAPTSCRFVDCFWLQLEKSFMKKH